MNKQLFTKAYHFCDKEFFYKLRDELKIEADDRITDEIRYFAYDYLYNTVKINNGNGMFFLWENPEARGYEIKYCDESKAESVLIEFEIPSELCVITDYYNWSSFIMDLHEANGDYEIADKICREEFGIKGGLKGSFNNIYHIDEHSIIQILAPYFKYEWVKNFKFVEHKII